MFDVIFHTFRRPQTNALFVIRLLSRTFCFFFFFQKFFSAHTRQFVKICFVSFKDLSSVSRFISPRITYARINRRNDVIQSLTFTNRLITSRCVIVSGNSQNSRHITFIPKIYFICLRNLLY